MIKTGIEEDILKKIVKLIKSCFPDANIYLFGSRANGSFRETSDIDIAIDAGVEQKRTLISEVSDILNASHIPYSIDILDLNSLDLNFKKNILTNGLKIS